MTTLMLAWRALRRAPAFSVAAALTLAIGIGATTAVFTVLDTILLKPLPYREPDRLAGAWISLPGMGFRAAPQSTSSYFTFRRLARTIDGIAVFDRSAVNLESSSGEVKPERVRAALASASVFSLLGPTFERGRGFTTEEDVLHGNPVAIISDGLWRRRFGGDAGVIGKTIQVDGEQRTIVGVAPPEFRYPDAQTQLWLPIALDSATPYGGGFAHAGFVRLKPGVSLDAAQRELDQLLPRVAELYPNIVPGMPTAPFLANAHARAQLHPMRDDVVGTFGNVVYIAAAAGALLLLISFANVASLLLTRAEGRQRELAVRVALGAGPRVVVTQFLAESLVLAMIGGAFGLLFAWIGVRAFVGSGPPTIPRLAEMGIGIPVVAFAIAVTLVMAALCSAVPALRYDTRRLAARLRDGTRGGTTGRDRQRARRTLVVTQVAFATVLVGGAGLLLRSFQTLQHVQPGFDAEHALVTWLALPRATYRTDADVVRFTTQIEDRLRAVPGVRAAGVSSKVPLNPIGMNFSPLYNESDQSTSKTLPPSAEFLSATGAYFNAMGIPLIAGRTFDRPGRQNPREAIIDRAIAARYWNDSTGAAAIGKRVGFTKDRWYTVIGVVGAVHDTSLAAPPNSLFYAPDVADPDTLQSAVTRTLAVVVRASGDARALMQPVQRAIAEIDPRLPPFGAGPMIDLLDQSMARLSFVMTIIGVTVSVAVVLAAIGLYGVLAYIVSLRSREISVRLAMGAMPSGVARLVTTQGVVLATAGVVLGVIAFLGASRFLRATIVGVRRPDPLTIGVVAAVLMTIAVAASWIPARRASKIDPARALSGE